MAANRLIATALGNVGGGIGQADQLRLRNLTEGERAGLEPARLRQGAVMGLSRSIADAAGGVSQPVLALSTLALMERRGTITLAQRRAGEAFHACFRVAQLDGLRAADMARVSGGTAPLMPGPGSGHERARRRISAAMTRLGGECSVTASAAWHVLGLEWSLRRWGQKACRGNVHQAAGVVLAALDLLEDDFGG